jgi:hypothetical protein
LDLAFTFCSDGSSAVAITSEDWAKVDSAFGTSWLFMVPEKNRPPTAMQSTIIDIYRDLRLILSPPRFLIC